MMASAEHIPSSSLCLLLDDLTFKKLKRLQQTASDILHHNS